MRWLRYFILSFVVTAFVAGMFVGGFVLGTQHGEAAGTDSAGFNLLWQVRDILNRDFLGQVPAEEAQVYGAVHGLVGSYDDQYTMFVEPAPRELERDQLRGSFGGIGASIGRDEAGNVVLAVIRDRPAARAGVQDGDILLAVDGHPVSSDVTVSQMLTWLRGDVGTTVTLQLRRAGRADPFDVSIVRERIDTPSVEWRVIDGENHIGYVRISIFGERTSQELDTGLDGLASQGVSRLILDLRGNGGGLVDTAVEVTSRFVSDGVVLREQKRGAQERFYPVQRIKSPGQSWSIGLLVDGGTASASEIVAGALRDHQRAVLIGQKTFGKGSVQEVHELPDGSSLHVTVARWLTPDRHEIDKVGLQPDIAVDITSADRDAGRDPQLQRARTWLAEAH